MTTYKIELPTVDEAKARILHKHGTPLDFFVYYQEPFDDKDKQYIFRDGLEQALQYAIEEQEAFRRTLDAPDSEHSNGAFCPNHPDTEIVAYCPIEGCDYSPFS